MDSFPKIMGTTFKYISDRVLEHEGFVSTCSYCGVETKLYFMNLIEDGTGDPPSELCIQCIKTQPVQWFPKHDEDVVRQLGAERFPDKRDRDARLEFIDRTREEYRRTPDLPNLINWGRWPVCCSDFTEYLGDAGTSYTDSYDGFEWYGHADHFEAASSLHDLVESPDFLRCDPYSLFRCLACDAKFWTHNI